MLKRRLLIVVLSRTSVVGVATGALVASEPSGIPIALKTRHD